LLPNYVSCSEFGIRCRSWIVYKEFVIHCWNLIVCSELMFATELCVLRWIWDSLPKYKIELFAANNSLQNCVSSNEFRSRCRRWIVYNEFVIRCRNWVIYSELAFAAAKYHSLPKLCANSEIVFVAAVCSLQRTSFQSRTVQPAANQFVLSISIIGLPSRNDSNVCNNFIVWWCKIWNTWMWTYEFLK
jgi:hypothetical protein